MNTETNRRAGIFESVAGGELGPIFDPLKKSKSPTLFKFLAKNRGRNERTKSRIYPGPALESVITQRLTFADGSKIIVTVKAPPGEREPGLLAADLASRHYYAYLVRPLDLIEAMSKACV